MTKFRPCVDLHEGKVKQIVGGTLDSKAFKTNFTSTKSPEYFVNLYKSYSLVGGHVIKLGNGNDAAALEAIHAWPNSLQLGGGIDIYNASYWVDQGASKVIVTSWLFPEAKFEIDRLRLLVEKIGTEKLVIDLSCRVSGDRWVVATEKWQRVTEFVVNEENLENLSEYCSEFLVHAADVEGLCQGIDENLVFSLGRWSRKPVTYAGGAKGLIDTDIDISDLDLVYNLSNGVVDLTFGSALDVFGGSGVKLSDAAAWNNKKYPCTPS